MIVLNKILENGHLTPFISPGRKITVEDKKKMELWVDQEGNIPSIYRLRFDDVYAEINILNDIVIGFNFKIDEHFRCILNGKVDNEFEINRNCSLELLLKFFNYNGVEWYFDSQNCVNQNVVVITKHKIAFNFIFDNEDWGIHRFGFFDMEMYNSMVE